ncbi:hypothetical protein [Amycolatopsis sp. CA-126428]|uniref:hypothetical protein n=1 Tax=Amycolatopsis sp. CA-126428 TaxID=2073158 RepID=UPI001E4107A0|nr:hypothetical protein [Amycolatopsis sp. CA-126428]
MSSTADARRDAPVRPALTPGEPEALHARARAPRPWTTSLQRPAAKILVAGGLTLAGWLLGAALSGSTASAADRPACPEAPVVSTVDHAVKPLWHARHRKGHHETGAATCAGQPKADSTEPPAAAGPQADETTKDSSAGGEPTATTPDSDPAGEPVASESSSTEEPAATTPDSSTAAETAAAAEAPAKPTTKSTTKATSEATSEAPKATSSSGNLLGSLVGGTLKAVSGATTTDTAAEPAAPTKTTSSGGDLLGGLLGGVLDVVGGTLSTVTGTVGAVTDTLSHTVLAPLTQPLTGNPGGPVLLPLDDILGPVLGGSNSGGVIAVVPGVTAAVVTQAPATVTVTETVPAAAVPASTTADPQQAARGVVTRLVVLQHADSLPVVHERPRDSGTHATGGGGDSTPGLPGGGTTAPSAPAPTAAPGHDGPGGARHAFAVHTDDVTTTQLKLIGTSRDHEVDGAGREAALPTTSPD